ncbi:hypothetical protein [Nocardia sp. NPDC050435]|uniref:hypothetical protein n=1 Tax=Nocardia sp. NPDC050435 TaxID=3155040 RepID=UPI00340F6E0D
MRASAAGVEVAGEQVAGRADSDSGVGEQVVYAGRSFGRASVGRVYIGLRSHARLAAPGNFGC